MAYKLAVLEIFFVLAYIAFPRYPYIRVYRLDDVHFLQNGNFVIIVTLLWVLPPSSS